MRALSPRATRRDAAPRPHHDATAPSAPSTSSTRSAARRRTDEGLSLVEMVVAVGIVMVVLTSALSVFVLAKKAQQTAEGTDQATQLAYEHIERIRQLDWTDIGFRQTAYNAALSGGVAAGSTTTTAADYAAKATIASGEQARTVLFTSGTMGAGDIKPYQVITANGNKYRVYTAITFGVYDLNGDGTNDLPTNSATTSLGQYSFKRVTVTVHWNASGNGSAYRVYAESWFAPEAEDAIPPGVPCLVEETRAAC